MQQLGRCFPSHDIALLNAGRLFSLLESGHYQVYIVSRSAKVYGEIGLSDSDFS